MLKRSLDIAVATTSMVLLAPIYLLLALAVFAGSGSPILFRQQRIGRRFRPFTLYKFRSMRTDGSGGLITAAGDVRVTPVGRILRVTKLDELPQLWNVLQGDMSLVGPRPEVPAYVELFRSRYEHVLQVRPGLTDLASVRFQDEEELLAASSDPLREYADRILPQKLDLADEYVRRQSLATDFAILFQTFRVIVMNKGR